MRLAIALAAMAALGLPGSGTGASTTGAPPATGYAAVEISAPAQTDMRTSQINACVADSPVRLPAGTNTNLVCSCAVDNAPSGCTPRSPNSAPARSAAA
jgi:hypothetical protein